MSAAMALMRRLADMPAAGSVSGRFRRRRFTRVAALLESLPRPVRILDVGGTQQYWENVGLADREGFHIVLVNLRTEDVRHANLSYVVGDARSLEQFSNGDFDFVFSNSVIEHVGGLADQRRMAAALRRLGGRLYVQTPNRRFPMEPHFLFPLFQYLPEAARIWLLMHMELGWYPRQRDRMTARAIARSIRLLTRREVERLFPGAHVTAERVLGWPKSFEVFVGWSPQ